MTSQPTQTTTHWIITIGGGYGSFYFEGDEAAAEEMRRHKARWEGAIGRKRPATPEEIAAKHTILP